MGIKEEIENLRKEIEAANRQYYIDCNPEISDYEFDKKLERLNELEKAYPEFYDPNSPTKHVGAEKTFNKVAHRVPMLSLQDVFSYDEVRNFCDKVNAEFPNTEYVVEMKIDGLSTSMRFINGKLSMGITRGDGHSFGENITENIKQIKGIPHVLKEKIPYLEVRGEVYMPFDAFRETNKKQELKEEKPFKNARNAAAGTLRVLDPNIVKERGLKILIFNLQDIKGKSFKTHSESLDWIRSQGFSVVPKMKTCKTTDEILEEIKKIGEVRKTLPFPIDGAVVKVNSLDERKALGDTSKYPHWAVAYKYPPEEKKTVLRKIEANVGRTGRLTPVAHFDTVQLAGTNVSSATLHNQKQIDKLDIRVGDTIIVRKAADIIPEIIGIDLTKRPKDSVKYKLPSTCPICGAKTEQDPDGIDTRCTNIACPAQFERLVIHFCGKSAMNISGMGESTIDELIKGGYIKDLADIYYLKDKRDKLISSGIIGKEKTVDKILKAIEKSKENDIDLLIKGIGIKGIGKHVGNILKEKYGSLTAIANAKEEDIENLPGLGKTLAQAIISYFSKEENIQLLKKFENAGLNFKTKTVNKASNKLDGKIFVITGTMSLPRNKIEEIIKKNGGKVSSSVSKKTDFLIAGENAGSKLDKADKLNVKVIFEQEFEDML